MMAKKKKKASRARPSAADSADDDFDSAPSVKSAKKKKKKTAKVTKKKRSARKPRSRPEDENDAPVREISDKVVGRPNVSGGTQGTRRVVDLDERKLSKAQKKKLERWDGENRGKTLDHYFSGQIAVARAKFGNNAVMAGSETDNLVIGIPCPALAFEYLITQDIFPLGLVIHLNGLPGSLKSALLYEFFRWFRLARGGAILMENETKYSPDLARSIMGYDDYEIGLILNRCESVEDWQDYLTYWVKQQKLDLVGTKKDPGPGRTIPIIFGVDSIMGKVSWETQEKILGEGHAGRSFPVEALSITNYLKTIPHQLDLWPFALVLNNHLKLGKDEKTHREIRRTGGGAQINFQEAWELETRVSKQQISSADWNGVQIRITCVKNSFGDTHRRIVARMLWWEEENKDTGRWEQATVWDWDWATVHMLTNIEGREKAKLKAAGFHIEATKTSDVDNRAWSRSLGMTKSEQAVSWSELGAQIRVNKDLMVILRRALGIKTRPLLSGCYQEQVEGLRQDLP